MKNKSILEIVVPTYNRPKCIEYFIEKIQLYNKGEYPYSVSIFDSSTNSDTEKIVLGSAVANISYIKMDSSINVDEKTLLCLREAKSDFVLLTGDGFMPNVPNIFSSIDFENSEFEIITLYKENQKSFYKKYLKNGYKDKEDFFRKDFCKLTMYGGSICRKEIFERMDINEMVSKFYGTGLIYPCTLANYAKGPFLAKLGNYFTYVPYKRHSGWIDDKKGIEIWTKNLYEAVKKLDNVFSEETICYIYKKCGKFTRFLTVKGLMGFRSKDNFNCKILKKYKFYFKKCKACSMFSAYLIAITPKFVFVALRKIYKKIKK